MTETTRRQDGEQSVDGRFVRAVIDGVVQSCGHFEDRTRRVLAEQGIENPEQGAEYELAAVVEAIWALQRTTGPNTVNRIGRVVAKRLSWSGRIDDLWTAFGRLDAAYRRTHPGTDTGSFRFTSDPDGGTLGVETPYPAAFERGLIRGVGKRFGSDTGYIAIRDERSTGESDTTQVYELVWWDDRREVTKISSPRNRSVDIDADTQPGAVV